MNTPGMQVLEAMKSREVGQTLLQDQPLKSTLTAHQKATRKFSESPAFLSFVPNFRILQMKLYGFNDANFFR